MHLAQPTRRQLLVALSALGVLPALAQGNRPVRIVDVAREECLRDPVAIGATELAAWFAANRLRAHVSITDETDYAASFVVVEQSEE